MSLQSLINLRTKYKKAPTSVMVLVGNAPKWMDDTPGVVVVKTGAKSIDLRALIGLHVDVIEVSGADAKTTADVMTAVEAANPKTKSIACRNGVIGVSAEHEKFLERVRRLLCS